MKVSKSAVIAATVLGAIATVATTASTVFADVAFNPVQSRYPRGTRITLTASTPASGTLVAFYKKSDADGRPVLVGLARAGRDCIARLGYTVPTSASEDNVYISAVDANSGRSYGSQRIPIGR